MATHVCSGKPSRINYSMDVQSEAYGSSKNEREMYIHWL